MQETEIRWSEVEKKAAQEVFEKAYHRETAALIQEVNQKASLITKLDDVWRLHDYLSAKRHDIDGKYDYNYSMLIFVFAKLLKQGWLHLDELEALDKDKRVKISALSRM